MNEKITVETVAEVQAVERQTIDVEFFPETEFERASIQLTQSRFTYDLQFISLPVSKAEALIEAIRQAIRQGQTGSNDSPHRGTLDQIGGSGPGYDHPAHNAMRAMLGDEA